jgi:predicted nucleotidyltransferase
VIDDLRRCARQFKQRHSEVIAVYLFGSFATRTATPRSDADILVEISEANLPLRDQIWEAAMSAFLDAPVPIDLFIASSDQLRKHHSRGVARRVVEEGIQLG